MGVSEALNNRDKRTRLMAVALALGVFATLPTPQDEGADFMSGLMIPLLWLAYGTFCWSLWFRPDLQWVLWFASTVLSLVAWYKGAIPIPGFLMVCWALWFSARTRREKKI